MKRNKIIIVAITLFLISAISTYAQKTTFGITAGFNLQNINGKNVEGGIVKNQLAPKYAIGINAEIPLASEYFVQAGVKFAPKGANSEDGNGKTNINYGELLFNFLYKPQLGNGKLLLGFGPYIGMGINGKETYGSNERNIVFKSKINVMDLLSIDKAFYNRADAGVNLLAGYEFQNGLSFQLNAQLGLMNINPQITDLSSNKAALKNTGFGLSLGYRFN